jgi:hypothetical protein
MNLKIDISRSQQMIKKKRLFVWRWETKAYYIGVLYTFVLGIFFLYYGVSRGFTLKAIPVEGAATIYNLHIGITIGSALIIVAILRFVSLHISRKNFFEETDHYVRQVGQSEISIHFYDAATVYSDVMVKQEFRWEKFSGFVYKNGFLLLLTGKKIPTSFILHESEFRENEFKPLLNFVKIKLKSVD